MITSEKYDAIIITMAESLNNLFMALDDEERETCYYPNR